MEFVITDLVTEILVRFEGSVPDLVREGHSAIVKGFLRHFDESDRPATGGSVVSETARAQDCYFRAVEVLAKHDEKYMPKEVAEVIERNKKLIEAKSQSEVAETTTSQIQVKFLKKIKYEHEGVPCHSTGGAIVLKAAFLRFLIETLVEGVIMTSPALSVTPSHPIVGVASGGIGSGIENHVDGDNNVNGVRKYSSVAA